MILVGIRVIITGAVVAAVVLSRPAEGTSKPVEDTNSSLSRVEKVNASVADLVPLNKQAFTWLTETEIWEPDDGDPYRDYL